MASKLTLTVSQLGEYIRRMMQLDPPVCVVQAGTRAYFGLDTPNPQEEYRMLLSEN